MITSAITSSSKTMNVLALVCLLISLLPPLATAQSSSDVPVFPTNDTNTPAENATIQLRLADPINPGGPSPPMVINLTSQGYNDLPNDGSANTGKGQSIVVFSPQDSSNITLSPQASSDFDQAIAYISCDASSYQGNIQVQDVVQNALEKKVAAVLFYSTEGLFCNLASNLSASAIDTLNGGAAFTSYYTMTNSMTSSSLLTMLGGTDRAVQSAPGAQLLTQHAYDNVKSQDQNGGGLGSTSPQTAVAMIILYSITGVITALFLIIIVTGAIRAHRHPERYGPRNVLGRARQNRAKGIARAMLDSIPIVKFGEGNPADEPRKDGDVEMANQANQTTSRRPSNHREDSGQEGDSSSRPQNDGASERRSGEASTAVANGKKPDTSSPKPERQSHDGREEEEKEPETPAADDANLGCSICTEDFERGQEVRVLPCDHKFHPACVDPWLLDVSGTCPLCRVDLRPRNSSDSNNEQDSSDLPPPLDPTSQRNPNSAGRRRRDLLLSRIPGTATRDQRLEELRRYRHEQNREISETEGDGGPRRRESRARDVDGSRLERVRRSIFSGRARNGRSRSRSRARGRGVRDSVASRDHGDEATASGGATGRRPTFADLDMANREYIRRSLTG